jgi:hypothetical protein
LLKGISSRRRPRAQQLWRNGTSTRNGKAAAAVTSALEGSDPSLPIPRRRPSLLRRRSPR